jgi:hypothetical protein
MMKILFGFLMLISGQATAQCSSIPTDQINITRLKDYMSSHRIYELRSLISKSELNTTNVFDGAMFTKKNGSVGKVRKSELLELINGSVSKMFYCKLCNMEIVKDTTQFPKSNIMCSIKMTKEQSLECEMVYHNTDYNVVSISVITN